MNVTLLAIYILSAVHKIHTNFLRNRRQISTTDDCKLSNIRTQSQFNTSRFAGKWYLISDYNVDGQMISNVIDYGDVQAIFQPKSHGNMKIATGNYINKYQVVYRIK